MKYKYKVTHHGFCFLNFTNAKLLVNFFGLSLLLSLLVSCKKFIEIDAPTDRITTQTLFEDDATSTAAVLGLYGKMVTSGAYFSNGGTTIFTGLASDELKTTLTADEYVQFQNNQISIDNSLVSSNIWRSAYEIIYHANSCIEGLENSNKITANTKKQLLGECYFIRGFCYWYLVNFFGDVPLITTTDYETNINLSKTNVSLVKNVILDDLLKAKRLLPTTYPNTGKLRVNYYTALALLSRFYLYDKNWEEVEKTASEIIDSKVYTNETNLNNVFQITSKESIWTLQTDQSLFNTYEGILFVPAVIPTIKPSFTISESLMSSFESNDLRKTNWITSKTVGGIVYSYPFKYKIRQNAVKSENYVMFRLAELYLSRAEARTHLNNLSGALDDLNEIRHRANPTWTTFSSTDLAVVQGAIQNERRIEFFAEWGNRWFDLKRSNKIDQVLSIVKPNWKSTAALFPIPASEMLLNTNLSQNSGYNN